VDRTGVIAGTMWDSLDSGFTFNYDWGSLAFRLGDGDEKYTWQAPIPLGHWSHVAATYDGRVASIYVDGELRRRGPPSDTFGSFTSNGTAIRLGTYPNQSNYPYNGQVDEFRFYDRALTQAEVRRDMLLAAQYRFETTGPADDSGPFALDESGVEDRSNACGPVGSAWERDGSDEAIEIDDTRELQLQARLTLRAWARPDAVDGVQWIVRKGDAFGLGTDDGNWVFTIKGDDDSTIEVTAVAAASLWSEVVGTFDGTRATLYVNGDPVANVVTGFHNLATSANPLKMGEDWQGALDEVEVRPAALRAADVAGEHLRLVSFDAMDIVVDGAGLVDGGPLALNLEGPTTDTTTDNELYNCLFLFAEDRVACPHRSSDDGMATTDVALPGPLTLSLVVQVPPQGAVADAFDVFAAGELALALDSTTVTFTVGQNSLAATMGAPGTWHRVAATLNNSDITLYLDGVLAGQSAIDSLGSDANRFTLTAGPLEVTTEALWIQELAVYGSAWDIETVQKHHAPWHLEGHPLLVSHFDDVTLYPDGWWDSAADSALDTFNANSVDDEDWAHYKRSEVARKMAHAVWVSSSEEHFNATVALLENTDYGLWNWGWYQGNTLRRYALAYDLIAPELITREAQDPNWASRHGALRRKLSSIAQELITRGNLEEVDPYYSGGFHHESTGWMGANSRLRVLAGLGDLSLALAHEEHRHFASGKDWQRLVGDELFYERAALGGARGRQLELWITESGMYSEGMGYQSDVFSILTPYLIDYWQVSGDDWVTGGRLRQMYDTNVALMMP
ncbi:MAG: hypothetical protein HN348_25345, partial [Proteobacteria bacterium]|nr:hypothetical protein [Pseudomonadota bacterium]